jgi:hypothetical protein
MHATNKGFFGRHTFPKFYGQTSIVNDVIKFDSSFISIHDTDTEIKKIFELGLVFPDLIYGASTMGDKFEFKKTFLNDTLSISSVSELHFPKQRPNTKSFSFLVWHRIMRNPSLYFFELTNDEATLKTTMKALYRKGKSNGLWVLLNTNLRSTCCQN